MPRDEKKVVWLDKAIGTSIAAAPPPPPTAAAPAHAAPQPAPAPAAAGDDDGPPPPPPPPEDNDPVVVLYRANRIPAAPADFSVANLLFRSSDGAAAPPYSSLYFTNGRIRLAHDSNAQVALHPGVARYCIAEPGVKAYKILVAENHNRYQIINFLRGSATITEITRELWANKLREKDMPEDQCDAVRAGDPGWVRPAGVGVAGRLVEILAADNGHVSRGVPVAAPALTQRQIDCLHHAASLGLPKARMVDIYAYVITDP